jgi:short-subunit dehydrogenase
VYRTLEAYGRIDVLINNAGVGLYALPTETPSALFSRLLHINVVAPLSLAQLVIPVMRDQGSGAIVTMGSVAAHVALPWAAAYSASKAALNSIHNSLRIELRRTPVHLVKVCAGIVDTDFRNHVLDGEPPERVRRIRCLVSPDRVAAAVFRALQRRRRVVYLPAIAALFNSVGLLAPRLMDLYLARMLPTPGETLGSALTEDSRDRHAGP